MYFGTVFQFLINRYDLKIFIPQTTCISEILYCLNEPHISIFKHRLIANNLN